MKTLAALLLLAGCGGRLEALPPSDEPQSLAVNPCGAPAFEEGACVDDVLNDGTGPDDHRQICRVGSDEWIFYPSGEQWHLRERDGGAPVVLCRGAADGSVIWRADTTGQISFCANGVARQIA